MNDLPIVLQDEIYKFLPRNNIHKELALASIKLSGLYDGEIRPSYLCLFSPPVFECQAKVGGAKHINKYLKHLYSSKAIPSDATHEQIFQKNMLGYAIMAHYEYGGSPSHWGFLN